MNKRHSKNSAANSAAAATDAAAPAGRVPVVGIGASAGGLEALGKMLKPMPADIGAAFVVVTHQHPGHTSLLPELLGKWTKLPVSPADDGMRLEPNHVYVGMPDGRLQIAGGQLYHSQAEPETGSDRPIDHFLRFLAADQGECAIGVILSGAGNDGTLGVKAIKAGGGMVMVQEPSTAKYDSMPASAIATGLADYVLAPDEMFAKLQEYLRSPYLEGRHHPPAEAIALLPEAAITHILVRLREQTGHDFAGYKRSTISRRIERRMSIYHIEEPGAYVAFLQSNPHEAQLLMQELLISVTSFFRDPEAFETLTEKALPGLLESRAADVPLRVWVPGCATGEEAYSVAMLLHAQMQQANRPPNVQIFGTDLDGHAIDVARAGVYPEGICADVAPRRLERYFTREDNGYRVRKELREMLVFAVQNLLRDPPFTKLDLIVCRNVLIYLTAEVQKRLLPAFHYALRPGGLLFLGSSETIGGLGMLFETVDAKWKIHRRKELTAAIPLPMDRSAGHRGEPDPLPAPASRPGQASMAAHVQRLLLARFAPPSVVVDAQGNIVYVQGRTGLYMEPAEGQPTNNVLQMAREGLGPALATALRQAQADNKEIVRTNVRVRTNHVFSRVDVAVAPIEEPEALRGLFLVTLQPATEREKAPRVETHDAPTTTREEDLEAELRDTRKSLQATIEDLANANEELRTSNEELQSTNEELQSTNEEMETSKEELQSLNEELNTVNAELQSKVDAIAQSNDDLRNLLNSTQVACVFLDEELKVKRYTEKARDLIRLIESDMGRPLADLTTSLVYDRLVEDCRKVLDTLVPCETEVHDKAGHWHLLHVLPYRTGENVIDGVVVTLVNIDRVREAEQAQHETAAGLDFFASIVQTAREPLAVLDAACRVVLVNDAFHRTFHTRQAETEGRLLYELGNRQWDIPRLRELLEKVLSEKAVITGCKVEREFPDLGRRTFLLNARRLDRKPGLPEMVLLAMEEVIGP
jgi:two-component system CheB/CheR fusion protein